ncbi:MAG: 1-acyl-sn-glycerol-3-phosphate acyltransferase [Acidobacteria bacterium]|nr:1-acyl-sn-glycerol-3-phosphate acyltransferase [Acidobacteriota bacterium]
MVRLLVQAPLAAAVTVALSLVAIAAGGVDRSGRACRTIAGVWARVLLRIGRVGVHVEGLEHLPRGPAVYAANHASALDIPVVLGHLPVDFRIIHKLSIYLIPLFGQAVWAGRHIGIDRRNAFRARRSLAEAARRIREGTSVVVYPEGTRSPDGTVRRFKRGSFGLALEAGVPIVPVSLVGVKEVVPRGLLSLVPGTVGVRVHAPVPVEGRTPEEAEALAEEVRQIVAAGCALREGPSAPGRST